MLYAEIYPKEVLTDGQIADMFSLYALYYAGTSQELFQSDLAKKDFVILLTDAASSIRGFSTLQLLEKEFEGRPIRVLFSGDTIVEEAYWGKNNLALEWIRFAGKIKSEAVDVPLYWLLIVKGHRTYRYLSLFTRKFYPAHGTETPPGAQQLMDQLALDLFGSAYDAHKGILHFPTSQGHLKTRFAEIPAKDLRLREVQFFLERNGGYKQGDELVCLCELTEENLRPFAARLFNIPTYV